MSFQYFRPNICFYYLKKVRVSGSDNIEIVKHIYIIHAIYLINSKRRSKKGSLMIRVMMFCFVLFLIMQGRVLQPLSVCIFSLILWSNFSVILIIF